MEATNREIARALALTGQLLEITGGDPFKIRAFARAADEVARFPEPVASMAPADLVRIPGIGQKIAEKIAAVARTGTHPELEDLRAKVPSTLPALLEIPGVGPKTVHALWMKLGVTSVEDLERAARGHRIRAVKGFGEKKEAEILRAIELHRQGGTRMNRAEADAVVARVTAVFPAGSWTAAGSYRRGRSTIGDIDLVTTLPPAQLNPKLRALADRVVDEGERKTSVLVSGRQVDVRFTEPARLGSMLIYLTGSKDFNIRLREIAIAKGMKLNEYGIEERSGGPPRTFADEESMFRFLGLPWILPELRENRGEIEAALAGSIPAVVEPSDLRGDLHVHTSASDGSLSLEELARAGDARGYEYLLCSDHSASLGIAHGLDPGRLAAQGKEIERVNRDHRCQILRGVEVDILADGSLGLPDAALAGLDLVVASVHSAFRQEKDQMTRRILAAMENPHVDIIGHPTGRLLGSREAYDVDMGRVLETAAATGTALEINASPYRLDLDDDHIRGAVDRGVMLSLGTDAHEEAELDHARYGIMVARRGWCRKGDLLNTRSLDALREWAS